VSQKQKNLAEGNNNSVINAISIFSTFSITPSCEEKKPKITTRKKLLHMQIKVKLRNIIWTVNKERKEEINK